MVESNLIIFLAVPTVCFIFGFILGRKSKEADLMEVYTEGYIQGSKETAETIRTVINEMKSEDKELTND